MNYRSHSESRKRISRRLAGLLIFAMFCLIVFSARGASAQQAAPMRDVNWSAMGSSPCIWPTDETSQHVHEKIHALRANGFGCYVALLWSRKETAEKGREAMDLSGLKQMLPAFNSAGISVWVVLIPPSEGGNSEPYGEDYVRWMQTLARLSLKYPHLRGVNIDDFQSGVSRKKFTPEYACAIYRAKQAINPRLQFAPTIYNLDSAFAKQFSGCVDGVWLWWTKLDTAQGLKAWLEKSRAASGGRFPIYSGVYAHSTSWHKKSNPQPEVLRESLQTACATANGAVIWRLPLTGPRNPLLTQARAFGKGGSARLAGRCGQWAGR